MVACGTAREYPRDLPNFTTESESGVTHLPPPPPSPRAGIYELHAFMRKRHFRAHRRAVVTAKIASNSRSFNRFDKTRQGSGGRNFCSGKRNTVIRARPTRCRGKLTRTFVRNARNVLICKIRTPVFIKSRRTSAKMWLFKVGEERNGEVCASR